jgi:hypothetical protein
MRIEDDASERRNEVIRQLQDSQRRLETDTNSTQNSQSARAEDRAREQTGASDPVRQEEQRREIQNLQARTQEIGDQNRTGADRHDDAVTAANTQQDRGQDWQRYAQDKPETQIPASVEEQRAEQQSSERRQEEQRINVRDLLNRMSIQSGKIDA